MVWFGQYAPGKTHPHPLPLPLPVHVESIGSKYPVRLMRSLSIACPTSIFSLHLHLSSISILHLTLLLSDNTSPNIKSHHITLYHITSNHITSHQITSPFSSVLLTPLSDSSSFIPLYVAASALPKSWTIGAMHVRMFTSLLPDVTR